MSQTSYSRNIPLFILFRVFFNARWYYPVMAVLFLDLGLSVEQYALLNVAWAAAIVGLEVPSGALADRYGRKKMVVFAGVLMVIEMLVFAFAPRDNPALLFSLFLINRLFSGAAEASASGADEALAYDSLVVDGRKEDWPSVLDRVMRWQSVAFFLTMMIGAAVYDAAFLTKVSGWIGAAWTVSADLAMHLPIYLTLGNAAVVLVVTLFLREPPLHHDPDAAPTTAWKATLATGKWIRATPLALSLIFCGLCMDSIVRLFLTFESTYFRVIQIPVALFGVLAAGLSLLGFVVPAIAKRMVRHWTMRTNFTALAGLIFAGLLGASFVTPHYGLLWAVPLGMAMGFTQFFISHYLNQLITDSRRRATVLSFRGLAFNLAYGGVGLMFAGLTTALSRAGDDHSADAVFTQSLSWLPWYFAASLVILLVALRRQLRKIPSEIR